MILITMAAAAETASFDEVLGASQALVAALGTVAARHEQLATFEGLERLALDAVLRVASARMDHLAPLLKAHQALANGADPTESLRGLHDGPPKIDAEAERLLPPADRPSWVIPSGLRYGSLAPELTRGEIMLAPTHSNGNVAGAPAINGQGLGTIVLAHEATGAHSLEAPGTSEDAEAADAGTGLPADNVAAVDATQGSELTGALGAGAEADQEAEQQPLSAPGATQEPSPVPQTDAAKDADPAASSQAATASPIAVAALVIQPCQHP